MRTALASFVLVTLASCSTPVETRNVATAQTLTAGSWRMFSPAYPTADPDGWPITFLADQRLAHTSLGSRWELDDAATLTLYPEASSGATPLTFRYDPAGVFVFGQGLRTILIVPRGFDLASYQRTR